MVYAFDYISPLGKMLLACNEQGLIGAWFVDQKHYAVNLPKDTQQSLHPILEETKSWLDAYFKGNVPTSLPPLSISGTAFQMQVWHLLQQIPYGHTVTYGQLANYFPKKMSAQAVGGAVGRNTISILVPCHRVVGANGTLTGYAGGLERKQYLLRLEGVKI